MPPMKTRIGRALARHEQRRPVKLVRGLRLGLQLAPRIAGGVAARAHVALAGVLFSLGRRRPMTLKLTGPRGPVAFSVPDHAALLMLWEMFVVGEYAIDPPHPPRAIVDLGANIGASVLFLRRRFPDARIVAVEASPTLAALLRENTRDLTVDVRPVAVAASAGAVTFYAAADSWAGSTTWDVGDPVQVPAVALDDLLDDDVDMIKIDVEGAEFDIMPASRRLRSARIVVGEIHAPPGSPEAEALLATLEGFDITTNSGDDDRFTVFQAVRR
jgi:FkbM family methyltransferase